MATFNIPFCKVSYQGRVSSDGGVINEPYFYAYWGATVEGEYLSNPYRLKITKISLHHRWKCNGGSGFRVFFFNKPSKYRIVVASYKGTSSRYDSVSVTVNATGDSGGYCNAGDVFNNYGNWTGSLELPLASEGGKLRVTCYEDGDDHGMIYSSESYPSDYTPVNPDLSINVGSLNVNNTHVTLNGATLTDLSSWSYDFRIYSDPGRTNLVWSKSGSSTNDFPFDWNGGTPGTTYYWSLDVSGTNSKTGGSVSMPTKTGSFSTQAPWISDEVFTYTASPLYNGHWTPRTIVSYSITSHENSDHATGLTFVGFEIQTALNGLQNDTKSHRVTALTGTISLTDLTKLLRAAKPRDLLYIKVRVVCKDNANREYFSNWFGMLTPQYIYNWYHIYLSSGTINNQLRINNRVQFNGNSSEKYWNKGEVK